MCACVCAMSLPSCLTLCNPMNCSPSVSSVHGILLYWRGWLCPHPEDLPDSGIEPASPALQADALLLSHQGSPVGSQSSFQLCDVYETEVKQSKL